ncbi:MAG: GFA family protein [Pseudomonadota bacterium]
MLLHAACHCRAVRVEVRVKPPLEAIRCNCSICTKTGFLHVITPASAFRLVAGEESLSCYTFNSGIAKHYFCSVCGARPFYIPRSNPDGYSVNARCLDTIPDDMVIRDFDGQNWEQHADTLVHLSRDTVGGK